MPVSTGPINNELLQVTEHIERGRSDIVYFAWYFLGITLHPGQIRFLREADGQINVLVPGNRFGKEQPLDAKILTPAGWSTMGDMRVGSKLFTQDGTVTRVTGVYPQGTKPIYRLTFNDGSSTEAGLEHLWKVQTTSERFRKNFNENGKEYPNAKYGTWKTMTTAELLEIDLSVARNRPTIPMVEPIQFPEQEVPIEPYLLGLLLGDGGIKYQTILTTADTEVLSAISGSYVKCDRYNYRLHKMQPGLRQLNLMGMGSLNKFIPDCYLYNTPEVRLAILQGLMDTDGSVNTENKHLEFTSISKQLADGVKFLVQSLGGQAKISSRYTYYTHKGERRRGQLSYRVGIAMRTCPFRIKRKVDTFNTKKLFYTPNRVLRAIEYVGDKEAQCITVAHPSRLYVTDDMIVTHNTVLIAVRHIWHNFYKKGYQDSKGDAWSRIAYRTCALAPDSKILNLDWQTIMDIMLSRFVISPKGEPVRTNNCKLSWYLLKDQCKLTPLPYIAFRDNSAIEFYSTANDKGTSVQGRFFGYGSYDEGGRSYWLDLELNQNIGPRFSELNAPLDLVSTPAQDSPSLVFHHDIFLKGQNEEEGYKSFSGSAYENVYLPKWYFEREEKRLAGNPLRRQVLFGEFVFAGDALFPKDDIDFARDDKLRDDYEGDDKVVGYQKGHSYVVSVDTAMGEDEMVYTVIDTTDPRDMYIDRQVSCKGNSKSPQIHLADFESLVRPYIKTNNVEIIIETWNGESARFYLDLPEDLKPLTRCFGSWRPPGYPKNMYGGKNANKADLIIALRKALAERILRIPNEPTLVKQLSIYREEDSKIPTDRVMSLALGVYQATDGRPKVTELELIDVEW